MHSAQLIYLGDLRLTLALAAAVFVWLLAAQAYRVAVYWCLAAGSAFGVVAASKIMYMGWGLQVSLVDFKALSGHAAGAAAVLPVVLYLVSKSYGHNKNFFALLGGWLLSVAVACALVINEEHSASEAFAGWSCGTLASSGTLMKMRKTRIQPPHASLAGALVTAVLISACIEIVPVGWWMINIALALSGARRIHAWSE